LDHLASYLSFVVLYRYGLAGRPEVLDKAQSMHGYNLGSGRITESCGPLDGDSAVRRSVDPNNNFRDRCRGRTVAL